MNIIVYGRKRQVAGYCQCPDNGAYMRILLDGGQVYVFAAANQNPHYDKMLVETPTEVLEAPDGNGDILTFADGTQARTGGGVMPFTKTDAEYMTAMRQADAAPANSKPKTKQRQPVTLLQAAQLCSVTAKTVQRWDKGEGTPPGYPGRQDAVTLRAWAARREEAAKLKRGLTKMTSVRDMDRATQKKQHSDWQADMRRRGATGYRSSDY
ncbi:MAG: hypothetical protein PHG29_14465 [Prolixibacteraceae bacterium]|nr:hypothetical protein [Prolixibacteraceae bacterium]